LPPGFFEDALRRAIRDSTKEGTSVSGSSCARRRVGASRVREKVRRSGWESVARIARATCRESCGVSETVAYAHSPAGLGEVAHGGVEERFGGLVHGRACGGKAARRCDRRPKPFA
jgi:hypothetical protein